MSRLKLNKLACVVLLALSFSQGIPQCVANPSNPMVFLASSEQNNTYALTNTQGAFSSALDQQNNQKNQETEASLERFRNSVEIVREMYVDQMTDSKILDKALAGLMAQLDPHSQYLDEEEFKALNIATSGEFTGVGSEVTMDDGMIKVVSPLDDSPAQKAGIQSGDIIAKINDMPVQGMKLDEAIKLIRGKEGTSLSLTIIRKGQNKPMVLNLTRAMITVVSVKERLIDQHYGYIRISSFQENTALELNEAINQLLASSKGQLRGVILDLRNNPGGLLPVAIEVADTFLDLNTKSQYGNRVVSTKGRIASSDFEGLVTPGDQINGIPLVALINQGSASASEIVAAALQDHHRAVIMGERSFGKGSVQTVMPLADGKTGIKITTARFYSPSGRPIQGEGVTPDVEVAALKLDQTSLVNSSPENSLGYRETSLSHALAPERPEMANDLSPQGENGLLDSANKDKNTDYQLNSAVNLLKGLYVLESNQIDSKEKASKKLNSEAIALKK